MCFDIFQLYAKKVYHKKEYCTSGFPLIQYVLLFSPDVHSAPIRKTAPSVLSAASQLLFTHKQALPPSVRKTCNPCASTNCKSFNACVN